MKKNTRDRLQSSVGWNETNLRHIIYIYSIVHSTVFMHKQMPKFNVNNPHRWQRCYFCFAPISTAHLSMTNGVSWMLVSSRRHTGFCDSNYVSKRTKTSIPEKNFWSGLERFKLRLKSTTKMCNINKHNFE